MGNGQECDARQTPACEGAEARLCIPFGTASGRGEARRDALARASGAFRKTRQQLYRAFWSYV